MPKTSVPIHHKVSTIEVDMLSLDEKLSVAFDSFERTQKRFLALATTDYNQVLNGLPDWDTERQREAAILNFLLTTLREDLERGNRSIESSKKWLSRLQEVMKREKEIYRVLEGIKSDLRVRLQQIKKGQEAIGHYHSGLNARAPTFVCKDT